MARNQTSLRNVTVNNMKGTTVSKTVELIVKPEGLVPDTNDTEPGVNSATNKN